MIPKIMSILIFAGLITFGVMIFSNKEKSSIKKQPTYFIIETDSCQYIGTVKENNPDKLTHRGRCKYCAERNKKLFEQLLNK